MTEKEIARVALLARIEIPESEMTRYRSELSHILVMVDAIAAQDTEAYRPLHHPLDIVARLRTDTITENDQHTCLQQGAPDLSADHYIVPKVI